MTAGGVVIPGGLVRRGAYRFGVIIELDGKLWTPVPEATVTAEEFIAARSVIGEIHQSVWWNPWVMEDRAAEYEAALETCGQWTRAEPDLLRKTLWSTRLSSSRRWPRPRRGPLCSGSGRKGPDRAGGPL